MWAENFSIPFPEKKPFQFPFTTAEDGTATDHWTGIEFPVGYLPDEDKLSIVLMNTNTGLNPTADANVCGMLLDEWVEIIPNTMETTGITFNYDQPDAKPPKEQTRISFHHLSAELLGTIGFVYATAGAV